MLRLSNGLKVESIPLNSGEFPRSSGQNCWSSLAVRPNLAPVTPRGPYAESRTAEDDSDADDGRRVPGVCSPTPSTTASSSSAWSASSSCCCHSACTGSRRSRQCAARRARADVSGSCGPRGRRRCHPDDRAPAWVTRSGATGPTRRLTHPAPARGGQQRRRCRGACRHGPPHFSEGFLLGLFFAVSAMAQARVGRPGTHLRRRPPPAPRCAVEPRLRGPVGGHPHPRPAVRPDPRTRGGGWLGRGHRRLGAGRGGLLPGSPAAYAGRPGRLLGGLDLGASRVAGRLRLVLAVLSYTAGGS